MKTITHAADDASHDTHAAAEVRPIRPIKFDVERWLLASDLPAPARQVMLTLCVLADADTGRIPARYAPSLSGLAAMTGLSRRAVQTHLNALEARGCLRRHRPPVELARSAKQTTVYAVQMPADARAPDALADVPETPEARAEARAGDALEGPTRAGDALELGQEVHRARAPDAPSNNHSNQNQSSSDARARARGPEPKPRRDDDDGQPSSDVKVDIARHRESRNDTYRYRGAIVRTLPAMPSAGFEPIGRRYPRIEQRRAYIRLSVALGRDRITDAWPSYMEFANCHPSRIRNLAAYAQRLIANGTLDDVLAEYADDPADVDDVDPVDPADDTAWCARHMERYPAAGRCRGCAADAKAAR